MHDIVVPEVEAYFEMPDEKDKTNSGWTMPEPTFRSSEGRDMKADSELPTESADRDLDTQPAMRLSQTVRSQENRRSRHQNKRRKSYWERNAQGLIVLAVLVLGLLIYLAWLYRGKFL